jgi:hypothetical protein
MDHTNCLQVAIKSIHFHEDKTGKVCGAEEWVVCERETSLSFIKITQSLI